jgi:hypothetical protein
LNHQLTEVADTRAAPQVKPATLHDTAEGDLVPLISLDHIERSVRELAQTIHAPDWMLPTFGHSEDGARPHLEIDPSGRMHYVVVERGNELERRTFVELDELMFHVFSEVSFSLAGPFELAHRDPRQDCRRLIFAKQLELLGALSSAWAEREAAVHVGILARAPFVDPS